MGEMNSRERVGGSVSCVRREGSGACRSGWALFVHFVRALDRFLRSKGHHVIHG